MPPGCAQKISCQPVTVESSVGAEAAFAHIVLRGCRIHSMRPVDTADRAKGRWMLPLLAIFALFFCGLFVTVRAFERRTSADRHDLVHALFARLGWSPGARPSHLACPPAAVRPRTLTTAPPSQETPQAGAKSGAKSRQPHKPLWGRPPAPIYPLDMRRVAISI
jgi:hypothetical protein